MRNILSMASDFIDRMSNPSYGLQINEEYTLQFAEIYSQEGFETTLRREIEKLDDINSLTGYGWLWLLGMARSKKIFVNEKLLMDIAQKWEDVFMQAAVIDLAIQQSSYEEKPQSRPFESGDSWLSRLIQLCISSSEFNQENEYNIDEIDTSLAEHVLIALLQVNNRLSVETASILLNLKWTGSEKLQRFFRSRLELLDEETLREWTNDLNFPY